MSMNKKELHDLAWRAGWTFVQAFTGGLVVAGFTDVEPLQAAAIGGAGAVLSLVKSVAGQQLQKSAVEMTHSRVASD